MPKLTAMSALIATHKRLRSHTGGECAFRGCSQTLFIPLERGEGVATMVGKECHIVAYIDEHLIPRRGTP